MYKRHNCLQSTDRLNGSYITNRSNVRTYKPNFRRGGVSHWSGAQSVDLLSGMSSIQLRCLFGQKQLPSWFSTGCVQGRVSTVFKHTLAKVNKNHCAFTLMIFLRYCLGSCMGTNQFSSHRSCHLHIDLLTEKVWSFLVMIIMF